MYVFIRVCTEYDDSSCVRTVSTYNNSGTKTVRVVRNDLLCHMIQFKTTVVHVPVRTAANQLFGPLPCLRSNSKPRVGLGGSGQSGLRSA